MDLDIRISKELYAAAGINTASNEITITNHDYQSGEILKYTAGDTTIGGFSKWN